MKKYIKFWPILVIQLSKSRFFLMHVFTQSIVKCAPPWDGARYFLIFVIDFSQKVYIDSNNLVENSNKLPFAVNNKYWTFLTRKINGWKSKLALHRAWTLKTSTPKPQQSSTEPNAKTRVTNNVDLGFVVSRVLTRIPTTPTPIS